MKIKHIWVNLSLFDGAAGEGGAEGTTGETSSEATESAAETQTGDEGEDDADEGDADPTPEEREKAYRELIKEYKDLYTKDTQQMINRRFKETKDLERQLNEFRPLMEMLGQRYKVNDIQSAIKAMEEDNSYWEQAAYDAGMTVDQYKMVSRLERENRALLQAQQQARQQQEADRLINKWREEETDMQELYPDFSLDDELEVNPELGRLLQSGVPLRHAYEVLHFDEIQEATMNYTAQQTAKAVTDSIRAKGNRPVENGASSQNAFTQKVDVSKLTDKEMDEYIKRAARGEKITF